MNGQQKRARCEEWYRRVEGWRESGLKQVEYARRHELNAKVLSNWATRIAKEEREKQTGAGLIPIRLEQTAIKASTESREAPILGAKANHIWLRHLSGWQVEFSGGVESGWLANLLKGLV